MSGQSRRQRAVLASLLVTSFAGGAGWLFGEHAITPDQFVGGPVKMSVHDKGRPIKQQRFDADSPEAKLVARWLATHRQGWTFDINSYAPSRKLRGERFDLNFFSRSVILNYQVSASPNRWTQVVRKIEPGDVPNVFDPPRPE